MCKFYKPLSLFINMGFYKKPNSSNNEDAPKIMRAKLPRGRDTKKIYGIQLEKLLVATLSIISGVGMFHHYYLKK